MIGEDMRQHIEALVAHVEALSKQAGESSELRIKKSQLSAIQKTIRQLERKGIPVPESLNAEKLALTTAAANLEHDSDSGTDLYNALLDIVYKLGRVLGRRPHHELYLKSREWRRQTTPPKVLREAVVATLKSMGGSGKEADVMSRLQERLQKNFTPADVEKPHGRHPRWHTTVRSERNRMIKEGLLTPESRRRIWTLAK